jgi:hypothetical protein
VIFAQIHAAHVIGSLRRITQALPGNVSSADAVLAGEITADAIRRGRGAGGIHARTASSVRVTGRSTISVSAEEPNEAAWVGEFGSGGEGTPRWLGTSGGGYRVFPAFRELGIMGIYADEIESTLKL